MRSFLIILAFFALVAATANSTAQEPARLALLIGNKDYTKKIGPLNNPHNDVDLVAGSLKKVGFKVTILKDASYKAMDTALKRYVTEVRRAGRGALSFFYYSGHGVANPETQINYLIPVDVADADDDKVWFESFQQNALIDMLSKQAPNATHYLVFDACRNELNVAGPNAKAIGTDKGFVPVTDTSGLLIAYATAPRRTASDAGTGGGPYAKVLAEELVKPGIEAVSMFRNVQIRVKQSIGQDPWLSFPALPPIYLAGQPQAVSLQPLLSEAAQAWAAIKDASNSAVLDAFIKQFGDTFYGALARVRLEELKKRQVAIAIPPPKSAPAAAQRAVFYVEDANDPLGKAYAGSLLWRTETTSPGPGKPAELEVRADIEVPDQKMTIKLSLRRNTDQALPASHTIETTFTPPADSVHGDIKDMPGLLVKSSEQAKGTPLSGLSVKVTNGFFLTGLSAVDADTQRNLQLLKDGTWFEIPILYQDGRRALLAIEKGESGQRAFGTALATWAK